MSDPEIHLVPKDLYYHEAAYVEELRECLILAVKDLELGPPVSVYTKFICVRARKALGLL